MIDYVILINFLIFLSNDKLSQIFYLYKSISPLNHYSNLKVTFNLFKILLYYHLIFKFSLKYENKNL